jgi:hypothetical protein
MFFVDILKVTDEKSRIRIRIRTKCHGSRKTALPLCLKLVNSPVMTSVTASAFTVLDRLGLGHGHGGGEGEGGGGGERGGELSGPA